MWIYGIHSKGIPTTGQAIRLTTRFGLPTARKRRRILIESDPLQA
jgi:hypothetical protein